MTSGGEPGAVTVAEPHHRWSAIALTLAWALIALFFLGFGLGLTLTDAPGMPSGLKVPAAAAFLAGIAVVIGGCTWGCFRGWRMGARFADQGVTVRNFLRIYRFGWAEVRCFADGLLRQSSQNGTTYFWALNVVLHDGRVITAKGTARKTGPRAETLAAIRQVAERYSVPAALTGIAMKGKSPANAGLYPDPGGQPGLRHWDGEEWSPLIQADPASGGPGKAGPGKAKGEAEVYSPLPGSEQQWHDAAARARRATTWFAVWLVATAGAVAGTVALFAHNADTDALNEVAIVAVLGCLAAAASAWERRKKFRKIDQAATASGGAYQYQGRHHRPGGDRGEGPAAG